MRRWLHKMKMTERRNKLRQGGLEAWELKYSVIKDTENEEREKIISLINKQQELNLQKRKQWAEQM